MESPQPLWATFASVWSPHKAKKLLNIWSKFCVPVVTCVCLPNPHTSVNIGENKNPWPHFECDWDKAAKGCQGCRRKTLMRNFQSGKTCSALSEARLKVMASMPSLTSFPGSCLFFFNSSTAPLSLTFWEKIICNPPDTMKNEAALTRGSHCMMITTFTLDFFFDPNVGFVKGTLITQNLHHISQHEHSGQDKALRMFSFFCFATYFHSRELVYNTWQGKELSCRNVQWQ